METTTFPVHDVVVVSSAAASDIVLLSSHVNCCFGFIPMWMTIIGGRRSSNTMSLMTVWLLVPLERLDMESVDNQPKRRLYRTQGNFVF
jgi:hypothetical protein